MNWIQQEQSGAWYIMSALGENEWVAWAKRGKMVERSPVREPGDVWFQFGVTRDQALERIKREIESLPC